jgi:D-arabinose 1-dehydrogenase-like Zn-dependent alcohol dehydrogenase
MNAQVMAHEPDQQVRAVLFPGDGEVILTTKMVSQPGPGQVLLRMRASGVCGSDLHFMHMSPAERRNPSLGKGLNGDPSITPGHEMAGVVEAIGAGVTSIRVGSRVAVQHYSGCGNCRECRAGWDCLCSNHVVYTLRRDGGFQDKVIAEAKDCIPIPEGLSYSSAAFIACGAGTSFQAVRRGELKAGQSLAAVGLGPVGLSALVWGQAEGARTIGIDPNPERAKFAEDMGVDLVLHPSDPDLIEKIESVSGYPGADVVIETAGNSAGRSLSLDVARNWGTSVFVSFGAGCELDAAAQIVQKQLTIRGSWMFSVSTMMDAMDYAVTRGVNLERLIGRTCSIEEAPEAIKEFEAGGMGKTVIVWGDEA